MKLMSGQIDCRVEVDLPRVFDPVPGTQLNNSIATIASRRNTELSDQVNDSFHD